MRRCTIARERKMVGDIPERFLYAMLDALPEEITVLDAEDRVIGWSSRGERLFERPAEALGRDVRACHSDKSLGMLERMLGEMKRGERDIGSFWYDHVEEGGGSKRKILVEYRALRDGEGNYMGCMETVRDIDAIRSLKGEKRLLD